MLRRRKEEEKKKKSNMRETVGRRTSMDECKSMRTRASERESERERETNLKRWCVWVFFLSLSFERLGRVRFKLELRTFQLLLLIRLRLSDDRERKRDIRIKKEKKKILREPLALTRDLLCISNDLVCLTCCF